MAVLTGVVILSARGGMPHAATISEDLSLFELDNWPPHANSGSLPLAGVAVSNIPVEANGQVIQGSKVSSYFDDYYFHVLVTPSIIDLGNLLTAQTRQVRIWNSFLEPVTVAKVDFQDAEGVTITPPAGFETAPFTLAPLQEISYTVSVDIEGPPNVDAGISWQTDHGDGDLTITGSRVLVFPFRPDWAAGIDETLSARSSVSRYPSGSEQSVSLRKKFRRSFIVPYLLKGVETQFFDNLIFGWQSRMYGMPIWPEQEYITQEALAGAVSLTVDTTGKTFTAGGLVMVFKGKDTTFNEIREILSVTSSKITVKTPLTNKWPAGSRIVPVVLAAASPQLQAMRLLPTALQCSVQFDCQPSTTDPNTPVVAPAALYRGYEIYLGRTNWRDGLSSTMTTDVQKIDFQTGIFKLRPQSAFSNIGRSHAWFLKTHLDVLAFRAWLRRREGKTKGVWMPSATDDFTLVSPITSALVSIRVKNNGYALLVAQHDARKDIYIRLSNGSYYARRIVDSADNGDGTMNINIDTALGVLVNPEDVRQFSFLTFYRMASDDVTIHWHRPGAAEAITGLVPTKALQ